MDTKKYSVPLSAYDYRVLTHSKIIALMIGDQLVRPRKRRPAHPLHDSLSDCQELAGWLAASLESCL